MTSRIGIMGGMFDPVHNGHLQVAKVAIDLLRLDQLRMVPCGIPNHRERASGDPSQRIEMLQLATQGEAKIVVDDREVRRTGTSYSIDTLVSIQAEAKPATLFFILGLDAFNLLPQWHRWQELFAYSHFVVINRPGCRLDLSSELGKELNLRRVFSVAELDSAATGNILLFGDVEIGISSSLVRERLQHDRDLEDLLDPRVLHYVIDQKLYRSINRFTDQEMKS